MKENDTHQTSVAGHVGLKGLRDNRVSQPFALLQTDFVAACLQDDIKHTPGKLLMDGVLDDLLSHTDNMWFQFEDILLWNLRMTSGVTEIHVSFEFCADGHLQGNHHQKRQITGEATASFLRDRGITYFVTFAEVKPVSDSGVAVPDSDSPQPK